MRTRRISGGPAVRCIAWFCERRGHGKRNVILKIPDHYRCRVFDANGVELKYAIWADTETGEAVHYVRDDGGWVFVVNDEGARVIATEWTQHPAPLRWDE